MENLAWPQHIQFGIAEMDNAHNALIQELAASLQAPDAEIEGRLQHIISLLETDFREEEMSMEQIGFSGLQEHREHHAKLLSALHHVVPYTMNGDHVLARQVFKMLPQWFLGHLVKMDAPLVHALQAVVAKTTPEA
eukprot:gene21025-21790_t